MELNLNVLYDMAPQSLVLDILQNNLCRGKSSRSYIGFWTLPKTINKFEERQMVVKESPVKVS